MRRRVELPKRLRGAIETLIGDPSYGPDDTGLIVKSIVDWRQPLTERSRRPRVRGCDLPEDEPGVSARPTSPVWFETMTDVRNHKTANTPHQDLIYGWERYAKTR